MLSRMGSCSCGCLNGGRFSFSQTADVAIFDVVNNIPYVTNKSVFANIGDEIIESLCGLSFSWDEEQLWASFPIGEAGSYPSLPSLPSRQKGRSGSSEAPQDDAGASRPKTSVESLKLEESKWQLLKRVTVNGATATPTMAGADQSKRLLCDRRIVTTLGVMVLVDNCNVQNLPYNILYRSIPEEIRMSSCTSITPLRVTERTPMLATSSRFTPREGKCRDQN